MVRALNLGAVVLSIITGLSSADAAFTGLEFQYVATVTTGSGPRAVYRIYARFTEPGDYLRAWGGSVALPTSIHTGPCTSHGFFQALPMGSNTAPFQKSIDSFPDVQWDTFATIGV